jgi:integrase
MLSRIFSRIGEKISSHDFRHGKLTDIGKFLTPQEVRDYAGHSNIKTTDRYLHSNTENVFKKLAKIN